MKVTHMPEDGKKFIPYEVSGNSIDFNDGELTFRADKRERDEEVVIDICQDYTGSLVMGASNGERYVAQLVIPAREYEEKEEPNPAYNKKDKESTEQPYIMKREPVPFDIDKCELKLWEMEVE